MAELPLPNHVLIHRRDGREEILLHRSLAVIGPEKVEIKSARSTVVLPAAGLLLSAGAITWMILSQGSLPVWLMAGMLFVLLFLVPSSVMGLVSSIVGADVIVDARKGSATWQQGFLGMGIGTNELVPFAKIAHLEVSVEGDEGDRWRGNSDDIRQFRLDLVKQSGKRLRLAQVPVPAGGQTDGMDRTLAVAQAVSRLTGAEVRIPEGWELVEIDADTGRQVEKPASAVTGQAKRRKRGSRHG